MEKRIWLMLAVLFAFIFNGICLFCSSDGEAERLKELIIKQTHTCRFLKEENRLISRIWNEMLNYLDESQPFYQEVKKFQAIGKEAEKLIFRSEQRLKEIGKEKSNKALLKKLKEVQDDLNKAGFINQFLINVLKLILAPSFGKHEAPEIPI